MANNGGATRTHALLEGSPAVNRGNSSFVDPDQRGVSIQDGLRDIGAFELQADATPLTLNVRVASNDTDIVVVSGDNVTQRFTAPFDRLEIATGPLDDTIVIEDLSTLISGTLPLVINGREGSDTLKLIADGQKLDLTNSAVSGIETIDLRNSTESDSVQNQLTASQASIDATVSGTIIRVFVDPIDTLSLDGNVSLTEPHVADNTLIIRAGWSEASSLEISGMQWTNPMERTDVDMANGTSALDALLIINQLSAPNSGYFQSFPLLMKPANLSDPFPSLFYDVSGDGRVTALDALQVINFIGRRTENPESIQNFEANQVTFANPPIGNQSLADRQSFALSSIQDLVSTRTDSTRMLLPSYGSNAVNASIGQRIASSEHIEHVIEDKFGPKYRLG